MMDLRQSNRIYKLVIGDYKTTEAFEVTDLQVTFDVSKSNENKKKTNSAAIEIYNLNDDQLKLLDTDYPACVFEAGYKDAEGLIRLISGQVTHITTRKSGPDRVTQIKMGTGYTELNHQVLSEVVPPGSNVKEAVDSLRKAIGAERGVYNGTNLNSQLIYGYPLSGTPKEMLDELCDKYNLNWQLEDGVLYVNDDDRANTENFSLAYVLGPYTGMVDEPYRVAGKIYKSKKRKDKKPGVQMKILLNGRIKAGDVVKLEDTLITGWYRVDEIRHTGGWRSPGWYTELKCSAIEKVDKKAE